MSVTRCCKRRCLCGRRKWGWCCKRRWQMNVVFEWKNEGTVGDGERSWLKTKADDVGSQRSKRECWPFQKEMLDAVRNKHLKKRIDSERHGTKNKDECLWRTYKRQIFKSDSKANFDAGGFGDETSGTAATRFNWHALPQHWQPRLWLALSVELHIGSNITCRCRSAATTPAATCASPRLLKMGLWTITEISELMLTFSLDMRGRRDEHLRRPPPRDMRLKSNLLFKYYIFEWLSWDKTDSLWKQDLIPALSEWLVCDKTQRKSDFIE